LIANAVSGVELTMIDSHTRAVEAAKRNSENFSIPAQIHLADDGIASLEGAAGAFDVFVGNPPYYSDYRIADVFLETAKAALKPGGVCYTVVKNDAGLKPVQERYFPEVEVIRRRGYCVLKSVSVS
jgi:16S rRNA (guanine1207-N2)-methyltransferase